MEKLTEKTKKNLSACVDLLLEREGERDDVVCRERKHSSRVTSPETVIGEK